AHGGAPRRPAGAVRHRHERGLKRLQFTDRLPEQLLAPRRLRREELERVRVPTTGEEFLDGGRATGHRRRQPESHPISVAICPGLGTTVSSFGPAAGSAAVPRTRREAGTRLGCRG